MGVSWSQYSNLNNEIYQKYHVRSTCDKFLSGFNLKIHENLWNFKYQSYLVSTIETASFKILSPNTNMYNTWSTLRAWKMARVATGSTADMREPNAKLSTKVSLYTTSAWKTWKS